VSWSGGSLLGRFQFQPALPGKLGKLLSHTHLRFFFFPFFFDWDNVRRVGMDLRAELEKGKRFALPSREKARQLHAAYVRVHLYLSEHSTGYYMPGRARRRGVYTIFLFSERARRIYLLGQRLLVTAHSVRFLRPTGGLTIL
jgi:hypothetical protein